MSSLSSSTGEHISTIVKPTSKYNVLSNSLRQITPGSVVCSMFCGGKGCKYDSPSKWSESQMAIKGLYSSWVTDDVLATSRPSTEAIERFSIIQQFQKAGIKSIINLQTAGEHASCGNALEPSGFSYDPEAFMQEDIFFYNFGWDDYGVRALPSILDMVKVMDFAVQEGKVAVHCHAGLGRTGVLIACYLIYSRRMDADHAIHYVREKRTGAIQTRGQMECCQQFAQFLIPLRVVFSSCDPCAYPFTLEQYLNRQRYMLHGSEERKLKHIPKIVSVICHRLLQLAAIDPASNQKTEAYDIRKSHPKAFHETREHFSVNEEKTRSLDDTDGIRRPMKLPPLRIQRKSSSLEQLMRSRDKNKEESDSIKSSNIGSDEESTSSHPSSSPSTRSSLRRSQYSRSQYILSDALTLDDDSSVNEVYIVAKALAFDIEANLNGSEDAEKRIVVEGLKQRVESLQMNLNAHNNTWNILATEEDPFVLSSLLWSWLLHLKKPVLSRNDVDNLCNNSEELSKVFKTLPKGIKCTVTCVLNVLACLRPLCQELEKPILSRVVYGLTHVQDSTNELYYVRFIEEVIMAMIRTQLSESVVKER